MLENFVRPAVKGKPEMWFQQDEAAAHTARATVELLRQIFGHRIISQNSEIYWPSRSPDLMPLDYFLWGDLKERVCINKPHTLQQLKDNICVEI